jgi:hypothetical protein
MAGKDDGAQQTASAETSETSEVGGKLPMPQTQSTLANGGRRLRLVQNEDTLDGQSDMQTAQPSEDPRRAVGILDRSLQERIGAILRDSFADIERDPLPERLTKLMEALRAEEKRR